MLVLCLEYLIFRNLATNSGNLFGPIAVVFQNGEHFIF